MWARLCGACPSCRRSSSLICGFEGLGIPGISTTYTNLDCPQLQPSIYFPTQLEILANICSIFRDKEPSQGAIKKHGWSVLVDEVTNEPRARYSASQDSIVGVCREHAHQTDLSSLSDNPVEKLQDVQAALKSGKCHLAKEITVVALAPFAATDYNARVFLASPTCKTESEEFQLALIQQVLFCWKLSPRGKLPFGKIWTFATDGDPKRRRAVHGI
jgi:hypothetical protein